MAGYHILTQSEDEKFLQVVFHIPVPAAGTNKAGTLWRDAVVEEAGGSDNIASIIPSVQGGPEETAMKSGAIIEVQESVRVLEEWTDAEKRAKIEARYTKLTADIVAIKQITLEWIGYSGDVA